MNDRMKTMTAAGRGAGAPFGADYTPAFVVIVASLPLILAFGGAGVIGVNVVIVAIMVAFVVCSPLRDGTVGHVISCVFGAAALLAANTSWLSTVLFAAYACAGADGSACPTRLPVWTRMAAWLAAVGALLVVLIVVSFARQMARAERSHLIRSLSHNVLEGMAMISNTGWCFLPVYMSLSDAGADNLVMIVSAVVMVLLGLTLAAASRWWMAEADPDEHARAPWVGITVLPVMFCGALIPVAGLLSMVI